jgi:uncharacterized protein YdaU (DUF1376 family)
MALPFMPFYWGDYWRDTAHLSDAEHVSYLRLISHYWQHGSLPTDDARLSRIAGRSMADWMMMRPVIAEFFQIDWRHKRIDRDLDRQTTAHEARVKGGKMTAAKRWADSSATNSAYSNQNHNQNHNHNQKPKSVIARGTRLPMDWSPRPEDGQNDEELAKFKDHYAAVAGAKGVKLDWDATWRNWLRNSKQWKGNAPLAKTIQPKDPPFPASGTIRYSPWDDKVRALGLGLDPDWIADQFRPWARQKGIAFDGPDIGKAFMGFARAQKRT